MLTEKDLRIVIDTACQRAYDETIKDSMVFFNREKSIIDTNKSGLKIEHRLDFIKGSAICGLRIIVDISLNTTFRMKDIVFTDYLIKYKDDQLDRLAMKICEYFDDL